MLHVACKGAAPALSDVVVGQVSMFYGNLPPAINQIKSGQVRALGVTMLKRNPELPEVPAIAETYPGFESVAWFGYFAPNGTPADVVAKFHDELVTVIHLPEVRDALIAQGTEPVDGTSEEFARFIKGEIDKSTQVARVAKVPL